MSFDRNVPPPGTPPRLPPEDPIVRATRELAQATQDELSEAERLYLVNTGGALPLFLDAGVVERWAWVLVARRAFRARSEWPEVPVRLTREGPPTGFPAG